MESLKLRTSLNTSKQILLPQIGTLGNASLSYAKSHVIGSEATPMVMEGKSLHQRCSSESFLLEQPSWLDDLLNEPETLVHRRHRRSSSDSSTYLGPVAKLFDSASGPCWGFQISVNDKDPWHKMPTSSHKQHNNVSESSFNSVICTTGLSSAPKESEWLSTSAFKDSGYESLGGSTESTSGHQIKNSVSKAEAKRTKQPSAHRSRIRKLQYIADLERNMQALQANVSEFSAALEFLDQHNTIMRMENRVLKQRLDKLAQEHVRKTVEMEMLQREIARFQMVYQLQQQQQCQNNNRELDGQFASLSLTN